MSEYTSAGGALKFKSGESKKKKNKNKKKHKKEEDVEATSDIEREVKPAKRKTPAELAFENSKRKKQDKELLKKAEKTHKERILELNQHLDSLSEHYDIPKVSWTK